MGNQTPSHVGSRHHAFTQTPWNLVMAATLGDGSHATEALEGLCRSYWPPIYSHLRLRGHDHHSAQDMTQEFLSRLLRTNSFAGLSPEKGRFRAFLLAALRHFLINEWKRENTIKRGRGLNFVALDALDPAIRDCCEPRDGEEPALAFDRRWALAVIAKTRERLRREYEAADQLARHDVLKSHLMDDGARSCMETAGLLGLTEAATKSAIHRIRKRFAELLRAEISRTVADPAEVEDEIRHLMAALKGF